MDYRRLGSTGLKVSQFCLGTMQWGWTADERTAFAIMDAFVEQGGNFLDTADFYSRWLPSHVGGESEEIIGHWMKARGNRNKIIVATKVYQPMGTEPNEQGLSRKHIFMAVEDSLRRLGSDYIDLYLLHAFDPETSIDETLRALDDLQRAGKILYAGASNFPAWRLIESLWSADVHNTLRFDLLEPHYNLVHREEFERDLKTICERYHIGVTPYSPLANGFLTGKYQRGENANSGSARAASILRRYNNETAWNTLAAVENIAREVGSTPAAVALACMLAQPVVTAPIIGANSVAQLQSNLTALSLKLTSEQLNLLDEVSAWQ